MPPRSAHSHGDATLLPPPLDANEPLPREERHLDDVGPIAVLGAMVEQKRRASQPSFPAIPLPEELGSADLLSSEGGCEEAADTSDADDTQPVRRVPADSDAFLKAR
jgi:hypothetical protein